MRITDCNGNCNAERPRYATGKPGRRASEETESGYFIGWIPLPGGSLSGTVCFRLKRFDILKIPSEQPLGCSAFIFRELRLWKFVLRDSPMNIFRRAWLCKKRSSEPAQRPGSSLRTHTRRDNRRENRNRNVLRRGRRPRRPGVDDTSGV